jgi:hypothetical protein
MTIGITCDVADERAGSSPVSGTPVSVGGR